MGITIPAYLAQPIGHLNIETQYQTREPCSKTDNEEVGLWNQIVLFIFMLNEPMYSIQT